MGPLPLLFLPIPMALFINFSYAWFSRYYNMTLDLVTPSMVIYLLANPMPMYNEHPAEFPPYERSAREGRQSRAITTREGAPDYERRFTLHQRFTVPELQGLAG